MVHKDWASATAADVTALYLRYSQVHGVHCPEAFGERQRTLGLFCQMLGAVPVLQLRAYQLTDFLLAHPEWKAAATRRQKADIVKACFQWAADEERISRNPFRKVRLPPGERRPDTPDELFEQICAAANKPLERALRFLRLTGCRVGELNRANWQHIDLDKGVWLVPQHKTRKKTGRAKKVALIPDAVALLRQIGPKPDGPVFVNNHHRRWARGSVSVALRLVRDKLGLAGPVTIHGIRHRFGSDWIANGGSLKILAEQMGHTTTQTTERYYVDLGQEVEMVRQEAERVVRPRARLGAENSRTA